MMTTTTNITLLDLIDDFAEAGLYPVDPNGSDDVAEAWISEYFAGFAASVLADGFLIVSCPKQDEIVVSATTNSGTINDQLVFHAPYGEMSPRIAAALVATVKAWAK